MYMEDTTPLEISGKLFLLCAFTACLQLAWNHVTFMGFKLRLTTNTYGSLENRTDNHHLLVKKILSTEEFLTKNMKQQITDTSTMLLSATPSHKKKKKKFHGWSAWKTYKHLLKRLKPTF